MREIKFRAWIKEEEIMTYFEDDSYILNGDMSVDAFDYEKSDCKNYFEPCYKTIDAELMQFTGLHDKNGKEIYEGDILKLHYIKNGLEEIKANVIYSEDYAQYVIKDTGYVSDDYEPLCDYEDLEVIGNIYDNAELLKGADNIE